MNCASCGQANPPDRLECEHCEALLVDVFASDVEPGDDKTDPISRILSSGAPRMSAATQYTGDLPRLFRFGDRYQILEKLGEGGMGRVYKALDLELDRPVALKTIRAEKGTGPDVLKRFKQELVLARKVTHKNVVRIYDLGEEEGMKFFTMELVEGRSLRDRLKDRGRIPAKQAVAFLKQTLAGLAEAHSQGVIHRDLKPQNIMVDERDNVRIMDFGIARTADTATMTGTGEMMGTPDYISPEQVKGENADAQSDLYSLGVILYEMLTGVVPFKGDTAVARIVARLQTKPASPRSICPDIPPYLERIVLKLMELDPDLRYRNADDVLQDLEREQVDRSFVLRARKTAARYKLWLAAAGLASSIGLGAWLYWTSTVEGSDVTTVAVVPMTNLRSSEELDWLEEGIPEMLVSNMAQSRALRPVLPERVHRILRDLGREGESRFDAETIRVISQTAPADFTLFGTFVESGGELRLSLTLRETSTGVDVPIRVAGPGDRVFDVVDELAEAVKHELGAGRWERNPEWPTDSVDAIRTYSGGQQALRNGAFQDAITLFEEAISHDPGFAMAHTRLAEAHFHRNDLVSARAAIENALPLLEDSSLSVVDRYEIQGTAARIDEDPARAVDAYGKLAELYPEDPDIRLSLASAIETLGENARAVEEYRQVLELNPDYAAAILGLGRTLNSSGRPEEAIALLQEALEAGRFGEDREAKGMAYSVLGVALRDMGRFQESVQVLAISLEERRQTGDLRGVMASLTNLSVAHRKLERFDAAEGLLLEALEIARESRNETMESFALQNLGNVHWETGALEEALDCYLDSLAIEQERKEYLELGHRLQAIAMIHARRGQLAEATVFLEQAKLHLESAGDRRELGATRLVEGDVARAQGRLGSAVEAYLEGLSVLQQTGSKETIAQIQRALAEVYAEQGRYGESLRAVALSVTGYRELGMAREAGKSLLALARAASELGALDEAEAVLELPEVRGLQSSTARHELELVRAELELETGRLSTAARSFESVMATARANGEVPLLLRAQIGLGATERVLGRELEALETLEAARTGAARRRLSILEARAALQLAETHLAMGDAESSRLVAAEAEALAGALDARPLAHRAHQMLAVIASKQGRVQESEAHASRAREIERSLRAFLETQEDTVPSTPEIEIVLEGLERALS